MMMTQLADPAPRHPRKRPKLMAGHPSWATRVVAFVRLRRPLAGSSRAPELVTATEPELAQAR